ncbi:MAG: tetratricopeptide repeat protein [Hassallia sp.]
MAEEPNPSSQKIIRIEGTAKEESKLTQVGSIEAENVYLTTEQSQIIFQLERINKPESPGVLKAGNSPKSLAYWQGRKTEIAQINQWLTDENTFLIGIEGIGGTGKSMLAAKIYEEVEGFPQRFWGDVSNGASFSDLARQVLTEFGFRVPEQEAKLVDALVKCLRSGQFLLIIDNLESLLQPDRQWGSLFYGDFFNAWVEYGGNSKVLVSTRERPELKGFEWLTLKGLQVQEGVALLTALGIRGDLGEFVELVDGHPLMLRLVADLLKEEYSQDPDLRRLADLGLGNLRQLLTDPQVVGVHRRENVGMVLVLNASFERLSELQKVLLLNISVYRGAVDSAAAVAVLSGSSPPEIERELRNLVKRSLLLEKLNGKRWYEFQPVVLEYARYKAGDQIEVHQRAIYYYLLNFKPKPWQTKEDIKEYLEVVHHWYQLENYDSAFNVLSTCNDFLTLRGYYTIQLDLWGQLIAAWEKTGERENWKYPAALINLGIAYGSLGQYQRAIEFHQQCLNIAREIGDRNTEGKSLANLGLGYSNQGQYQQAIEFFQESKQIALEIGERNSEGLCLANLGIAYLYQGQYQQAIDLLEQSKQIAMEMGDRNTEGASLMSLGLAYLNQGQYQQAIEFFQESKQIALEIGDRNTEGKSLMNLGVAYLYQGQYQEAIDFFEQSKQIALEIGDRNSEGLCLMNLGLAYLYQEQYQEAIDLFQQSKQIVTEIGDRNTEGLCLMNLGVVYLNQGQYQEAIDLLQQSLEISKEIGDIRGEANSWFNLGLSLENLNRESDALGAYRNARELFQAMGLDANVQDCNNAIERLSQPQTPVISHRGFWGWFRRLWRWVRSWFRQ